MGSGAFFFDLSRFMTQFTVDAAGVTYDMLGVEQDAHDPFAPIATRRAVTGILSVNPGHPTSLVVLTATASTLVQANLVGRNAPITVADLLIRMGKDEILDAMVARYAAFVAEDIAA